MRESNFITINLWFHTSTISLTLLYNTFNELVQQNYWSYRLSVKMCIRNSKQQ